MSRVPDRRWLIRAAAAFGASGLAGCDRLSHTPKVMRAVQSVEHLTRATQRLIIDPRAMKQEFAEADISPVFRPNGQTDPWAPAYKALAANGFADWRLTVDGLVQRPASLSLDQIRALPARTQITRHDCVEGWSVIGKWTGARLGPLLDRVGLKPEARFLVLHCMDLWDPRAADGTPYYESIDLVDAYHPQTILAYGLNGAPVPVSNGAPLRLRVERNLGYKNAKYLHRIEAVEDFGRIAGGQGGYWEDRGYEWFAGI